MVPFCCCISYATVCHIAIKIVRVVVLSVIIAPHIVRTPHISKTHMPIVLLKGAFSDLGQFLAADSPLKMMNNFF